MAVTRAVFSAPESPNAYDIGLFGSAVASRPNYVTESEATPGMTGAA